MNLFTKMARDPIGNCRIPECWASEREFLMNHTDYSKYYDLESYLFGEVSKSYRQTNTLTAFDFFCIIVWKANRAKSKVAKRLLACGHKNLDDAVAALLCHITASAEPKHRLRVLIADWGFRLPMASAILTVLFPEEFSIYDVRVCDTLNDFADAQYKTRFDDLWSRYSEYLQAVSAAVIGERSLRDKDRFLWGRSFATQLERDIRNSFGTTVKEGDLEI